MEPMMVKAILGERVRDADEAFHNHVVVTVKEYIDKTTGMQTLLQMKALVNLVRRFRCVPESEILDEFGYKALYYRTLSEMVNGRIQMLRGGTLSVENCTIRKAAQFLDTLRKKSVTLYLASGTDQEDVEREAEVLGYRHLFGDRIYGAPPDAIRDVKRMVLERILADIGVASGEQILTIGDGPVEIRETHKRGGYVIGVASDEVRRYGLNPGKRRRLIEAGADLIIPDYSDMDELLQILIAD
jgi:phosphoglycolate phosphatase-like HAD superfamily hydrolase